MKEKLVITIKEILSSFLFVILVVLLIVCILTGILFIVSKPNFLGQEKPALTGWGCASFFMAAFALFFTIITFYISYKTLQSQKKTESNTIPGFTSESQTLILSRIATQLLDNYCRLSALKYFVSKKMNAHPIPRFFTEMMINSSSIHLEIAYNKAEYFHDLSSLTIGFEKYNGILNSIPTFLLRNTPDRRLLNNEIEQSRLLSMNIYNEICHLFNNEFSLPYHKMKEPFDEWIKDKMENVTVENLIELWNDRKDSDCLRSLIPNTREFDEITSHVQDYADLINKNVPDFLLGNLEDAQNQAKLNVEKNQEYKIYISSSKDENQWCYLILSYITYKYYKKYLTDYMIVPFK